MGIEMVAVSVEEGEEEEVGEEEEEEGEGEVAAAVGVRIGQILLGENSDLWRWLQREVP